MPVGHQAIIWTKAVSLSIGPSGTNFSQITFEIQTFSFKKMHFKMSSRKYWPFCLNLSVLNELCWLTHIYWAKQHFFSPHYNAVYLYAGRIMGYMPAVLTAIPFLLPRINISMETVFVHWNLDMFFMKLNIRVVRCMRVYHIFSDIWTCVFRCVNIKKNDEVYCCMVSCFYFIFFQKSLSITKSIKCKKKQTQLGYKKLQFSLYFF